jgi:energy-coupling factor transporter transmembrane protein EcfT
MTPDEKQTKSTAAPDDAPRDDGEENEGRILEWSCHPVKRKPWVSVGVTFLITLVGVGINDWTGSRAFAVLGVVVLLLSLSRFYFPTKYRLSDRRIMVKTTMQTMYKEWSRFRSVWPDKNGVLLSPFAEASRLENYRGIYLLFDNNRDEVVDFIRARIGESAASSGDLSQGSDGAHAEGKA